MTNLQTFDFCVSETRYLADLYGIRGDLHAVRISAEIFLRLPQAESVEQFFVKRALCWASIATYGRTFGIGIREPLPLRVIESLGQALAESHRYFKALRDRWVAHSVNNFEQSAVTIQASINADGAWDIASVGDKHSNVAMLSHSDMAKLLALSTALIDAVKGEIEREQARVLEIARSFDLSPLTSNPNAFSPPSEVEHHVRPRAKFA